MLTDYQGYKCILTNVLYVPSAETSIISQKQENRSQTLKFSAKFDDFKLSYMKTLLHLSGQIIDSISMFKKKNNRLNHIQYQREL